MLDTWVRRALSDVFAELPVACCRRRSDEVRGLGAVRADDCVQLQIGDDRFDLKRERDGYWRLDVDVPTGTLLLLRRSTAGSRAAIHARCGCPTVPKARPRPSTSKPSNGPTRCGAEFRCRVRSSTRCTSAPSPPRAPSTPRSARLDHLVALGVDIVEVMPLATFPGQFGWGYDGVGLYAVHEPYGGPDAFHRFVDACHQRGIGICLDVVYNHLGPSGNHLSEFGPYFTARYGTPWGAALNLDDADSDEVRRFVIDNALMWFRDFHVDGLRLDAVHALFDIRAITLLEELSAEVSALSAGSRSPAGADRRVRPQRPADGRAARGRRSRPARAVGRRRAPCAARPADRREPGLLRRLRRSRAL